MNNKLIISTVILAVVVLGGYLLLNQPSSLPASDLNNPAPVAVVYTDSGYAPVAVEIKVGDTVAFQNKSSQAMWTASAMHPTHAVYPVTGGCIGSAFDACKGVQPGDSWSFKFDVAGSWEYHDHLNPKYFGTVVVK